MSEQATTSSTTPSDADVPQEVRAAANGAQLTDEQERSALDWFLGASRVLEYDVPVEFETPAGMKKLVFHLRQLDDARMQEIDEENRQGDPASPFRKLDVSAFNAALVAEAFVYVVDPTTGQRRGPEEVRGGVPALPMAFQIRFKTQPGLLEGLAARIREKAGFGEDRVGTASRSLVESGKDS